MWLAILVFGLFLGVLLLEFYAAKKRPRPSTEGFGASFCTHDGKPTSKPEGPLKLSLSPHTVYKNFPNQKNSSFTINSHGFRGGELPSVGSFKNIIIAGDSGAFGYGVRDNETISSLLETKLQGCHVINAGVMAFLSSQTLTYLVTELTDYHPDVFIVYLGISDLLNARHNIIWKKNLLDYCGAFFGIEHRLLVDQKTQGSVRASFQRFINTLSKKSALGLIFDEQVKKLRNRAGPYRPIAPNRINHMVDRYTSNLKKMNDFCKSQGGKFLNVIQPELGFKSKRTPAENQFSQELGGLVGLNYSAKFSEDYRLFIEKSKSKLSLWGIPCVDPGTCPEFRDSDEQLFIDVVHTSRRGNEVIAQLIDKTLKKLS